MNGKQTTFNYNIFTELASPMLFMFYLSETNKYKY